jgi:hypothetical protein
MTMERSMSAESWDMTLTQKFQIPFPLEFTGSLYTRLPLYLTSALVFVGGIFDFIPTNY